MKSLSYEKTLFLYFNGKHSPFFDGAMSMASNSWLWIPIYLIFILILIRTLKVLSLSYIVTNIILVLSCIALLVVISKLLLPSVFELFISRIRPCYDAEISPMIHLVGEKCTKRYGFYTFRSCTAFAISTFFVFLFDETFRWVKFLLMFWAFCVAYSRIYLGAHYPVDVFVSCISGIFLGYLIYRLYYYIKESVLVI